MPPARGHTAARLRLQKIQSVKCWKTAAHCWASRLIQLLAKTPSSRIASSHKRVLVPNCFCITTANSEVLHADLLYNIGQIGHPINNTGIRFELQLRHLILITIMPKWMILTSQSAPFTSLHRGELLKPTTIPEN